MAQTPQPDRPAACDSCGAALGPDDAVCALCGTPAETPAPATGGAEGPACPRCGHHPPVGSRFCNACGLELERPPAEPPPAAVPADGPAPRASSAAGKRGLALVGVGVAAVVVLYGMTLWSNRPAPASELDVPDTDATSIGEAAPIPDGAPPLPDTLQAAADQFAARGTPEGWYESGRYYLTAAFGSVQSDPESSVRWARRAIDDFEQSLALRDDPQVRVALAEAATFDPSDPMRPIQELRTILETDPDNLDATFLLGERRLMIGRVDQARESFERVLALAPAGSAVRERAESALASIPAE